MFLASLQTASVFSARVVCIFKTRAAFLRWSSAKKNLHVQCSKFRNLTAQAMPHKSKKKGEKKEKQRVEAAVDKFENSRKVIAGSGKAVEAPPVLPPRPQLRAKPAAPAAEQKKEKPEAPADPVRAQAVAVRATRSCNKRSDAAQLLADSRQDLDQVL